MGKDKFGFYHSIIHWTMLRVQWRVWSWEDGEHQAHFAVLGSYQWPTLLD